MQENQAVMPKRYLAYKYKKNGLVHLFFFHSVLNLKL